MARPSSGFLHAIDRRERIVLFGDYDVDGVTSLALLAEMLRSYGAAPELFLPLRMEEGYGLSPESVERCCEQHQPQLLIAVDCGTSSHRGDRRAEDAAGSTSSCSIITSRNPRCPIAWRW